MMKRKAAVTESLALPKKAKLPTKFAPHVSALPVPKGSLELEQSHSDSDSLSTEELDEFQSFSTESGEGGDQEEFTPPTQNQINKRTNGASLRDRDTRAKSDASKSVLVGTTYLRRSEFPLDIS